VLKKLGAKHAAMLAEICQHSRRFPKPDAFLKNAESWLSSGDVSAMSTEQAGGYDFLLCNLWCNYDLAAKNDPETLGRWSRLNGRWETLAPAIMDCMCEHSVLGPGHITNSKLIEVRYSYLLRQVAASKSRSGESNVDTNVTTNDITFVPTNVHNPNPNPNPNPKSESESESKRPKKQPSADGLELAKHLRDRIVVNCKSARVTRQSGAALDETLRKWGVEIDRIMRCDKRTKDEMMAAIDFAHDDTVPRGPSKFCWASQVQGPSNLRHDSLWAQMDAAKKTDSRWDYGSGR